MSDVKWVMSHIWMSMSHIRTSHVTHVNIIWMMRMRHSMHMNEYSTHSYMSHVTHMNESCHTYEWVMSHMNESCHTYEWVMSHMNESCHTYEFVWHDLIVRVPWLIHMCDMTHSYVCHDSFICVPWLTYKCVLHASQFSFMYESCHTYEWVHMNGYYHTYEQSCQTHGPVMSHTHTPTFVARTFVVHINFYSAQTRMSHVTHTNESCHTYERVMSQIRASHVTHLYKDFRSIWQLPERSSTNELCHRYERVLSQILVSHVSHT